jgi:hypothetical protein
MPPETADAKIYYCPFPGCRWAHVSAAGPEESPGALADIFGPGVFAATARAQRLAMTEQTLAAHLGSHTTGEWAIALAQANADRDQAAAARGGRIAELEQLAREILGEFGKPHTQLHEAFADDETIARWQAVLAGEQ